MNQIEAFLVKKCTYTYAIYKGLLEHEESIECPLPISLKRKIKERKLKTHKMHMLLLDALRTHNSQILTIWKDQSFVLLPPVDPN